MLELTYRERRVGSRGRPSPAHSRSLSALASPLLPHLERALKLLCWTLSCGHICRCALGHSLHCPTLCQWRLVSWSPPVSLQAPIFTPKVGRILQMPPSTEGLVPRTWSGRAYIYGNVTLGPGAWDCPQSRQGCSGEPFPYLWLCRGPLLLAWASLHHCPLRHTHPSQQEPDWLCSQARASRCWPRLPSCGPGPWPMAQPLTELPSPSHPGLGAGQLC